jgi:hypothetical protein
MEKPLLLLDVDGPLNPYAAKPTKRPEGYETHRFHPKGFEYGKGLRVWLNPTHGAKLLDLGYEIIWCTAWENDANVYIGPHIGLSELPVIKFRVTSPNENPRLHWKTGTIAHVMPKNYPNRPFIWVDDEVTEADKRFLASATGSKVEIFKISPALGLLDEDFKAMKAWKETLEA